MHVVKSYAEAEPLVLFSGDCYSPSLMSVITNGAQMPPVLNEAGVRAAVFGNHEFDFGVEQCHKLCDACDFPWLMSNCVWKETGEPLGGGERSLLFAKNGLTIGLMGLIEREWLATLSTISEEELLWTDFVPTARELAAELRGRGADVVIALTHMRMPNDERLQREVPELDLILGGHDHDYGVYEGAAAGATASLAPKLVKSGTDFRELSCVTLSVAGGGSGGGFASVAVTGVTRVEVPKDGPADEATASCVAGFEAMVGRQMEAKSGETEVALDARFATIRSRESNVSNFVADVLREATGADLTIFNAGTLRADRVLGPGALTTRDLVSLLPMADGTAVIRLTGQQVLEALENGVSSFPKLEGRFPCVSGLRFAFDPSQPAGSRVVAGSVQVTSEAAPEGVALELTAEYTVATKAYLTNGKDGYTMFRGAPIVVDAEEAPLLPNLVQNHFKELSYAVGASALGVLSPTKRQQARSIAKVATTPAKGPRELPLKTPKPPKAPPKTPVGSRAAQREPLLHIDNVAAADAMSAAEKTPAASKPPLPVSTPSGESIGGQRWCGICPNVEGRIVQMCEP